MQFTNPDILKILKLKSRKVKLIIYSLFSKIIFNKMKCISIKYVIIRNNHYEF